MNEHDAFKAHDQAVNSDRVGGRQKEIEDTWTAYKKSMVQRELAEIDAYSGSRAKEPKIAKPLPERKWWQLWKT